LEDLEEIIKGCISNKRKCQERLYQLFSRKMFGVCRMYSKDSMEAEDVLQDAFVKIFGSLGSYKNEGSFEGWVRRIVVNTALERLRKKNITFSLDEHAEKNIQYYDDFVSDLAAKDLMLMIEELSPQYKVVFILFAVEGYSHEEIGLKLGISEGTSKSNLSRARKILQNKIQMNHYASNKTKIFETSEN